jgi:hypothetical protein
MQRNYRNTFHNFQSTTSQGNRQRVFELNPHQSDYHNMVEFYDTKFIDVDQNAFAYIDSPNPAWAAVDDCGDFPCTAPANILFQFFGTEFEGSSPSWATDEFQIIANNDGFAPYIENCEAHILEMNGYVCQNDTLGVLLFESEDDD